MEDSGDPLSFLQADSNVFPYILTPPGLLPIIHPLVCHCPSHRINPFRTAQLSMQRVMGQSSGVITSQTVLSSAPGPLRFLPASIQTVSVLG